VSVRRFDTCRRKYRKKILFVIKLKH